MSYDTQLKYATIFLISFILIAFSSVCFDQWIDYQRSKQATKIEYKDDCPTGFIFVPVDTLPGGSGTYMMIRNKGTEK